MTRLMVCIFVMGLLQISARAQEPDSLDISRSEAIRIASDTRFYRQGLIWEVNVDFETDKNRWVVTCNDARFKSFGDKVTTFAVWIDAGTGSVLDTFKGSHTIPPPYF